MERPEQRLYHRIPDDMRGDTLHPLNTLKETHPDLYEKYKEKYADRMQVMDQHIPALDAKWNDVLHLTAVHPTELKQALIEAGFSPPSVSYFEIDPAVLDPERTTVYLFKEQLDDPKLEFAQYDPTDLKKYALIGEDTKEYYRQMFAARRRPLLFNNIPHILHKGPIDVSGARIITP